MAAGRGGQDRRLPTWVLSGFQQWRLAWIAGLKQSLDRFFLVLLPTLKAFQKFRNVTYSRLTYDRFEENLETVVTNYLPSLHPRGAGPSGFSSLDSEARVRLGFWPDLTRGLAHSDRGASGSLAGATRGCRAADPLRRGHEALEMGRSRGGSSRIYEGLRKLIQDRPDTNRAWEHLGHWHLGSGDDRSDVLLAVALLEQSIENAILQFFANKDDTIFIDQSEGNLSNLSMKIRLAYALGIIEDKIRKELKIIKDVRNVFAHSASIVRFDSEEISNAIEQLVIPKTVKWGSLAGPRPLTPREKFAASVRMLYAYLTGVEKKERDASYKKSIFYIVILLGEHPSPEMMQELHQEAVAAALISE